MVRAFHKPNSTFVDAIAICIILIAGIKFTYGLENAVDIGLYDESNYLYNGVHLLSAGLPHAAYAPLYAIWYFLISLLQPDRIGLYYLNYKLMTILPPILLYILLRRCKVSLPLSLAVSLFLLVSRIDIGTWPKVSHFALLICLATLILVSRVKSFLWTSALASVGALLVAYVHPEYFLAYLVSLVLVAAALVKEFRRLTRRDAAALLAYGLVSVSLLGILGLPVSADRSFLAFGQHFSLNWVTWTGSSINPWDDWEQIVSSNFGGAQTLSQAFFTNPSLVAKHMGDNVRGLVTRPWTLVLPTLLTPDRTSKAMEAIFILGLPIAYFGNIRRNSVAFQRFLPVLGIFLLPGLVSAVVIYPEDEILLMICVLMGVLGAVLLGSHAVDPLEMTPKGVLLLGALAIALTPYAYGQVHASRPILSTIRFLQSLSIKTRVNLLEEDGGYNIYLSNNYHWVAGYNKAEGFDQFLSDNHINMIVVSSDLSGDTRYQDDPEWEAFLADYPSLGYVEMGIPNSKSKLIARRDLLSP